MRILQVLENLAFGDAIGNNAVLMKKALAKMGFSTEIYAARWDKRLPAGTVQPVAKLPHLKREDVVIYHFSTGSSLNRKMKTWPCRKILFYHNVTPPAFFAPYDYDRAESLASALEDAAELAGYVDSCLVLSEFSKRDLVDMGYPEEKIHVMPGILIPFEDYAGEPDRNTLKRYSDGWTNILFVGRLSPNKKQEDIIRAFAYYKKHINRRSRLLLVGSAFSKDYQDAIKDYAKSIGAEDVELLGHIGFASIIACYKVADIFACMSEHEGFCVPLAEAMYFNVPIIAYAAAAVPETLGGSGVLLDSKDPALWANWIDRLTNDYELRREILEVQRKQLQRFDQHTLEDRLEDHIYDLITTVGEGDRDDPVIRTLISLYRIAHERFLAAGEVNDYTLDSILRLARSDNALIAVSEPVVPVEADGQPLVYCDVAGLLTAHLTGIQRVVVEIMRRLSAHGWDTVFLLYSSKDQSYGVIPTEAFFDAVSQMPMPVDEVNALMSRRIQIGELEPGAIFFELSNIWHNAPTRCSLYPQLKAKGIRIAVFLHDILAVRYPHWLRDNTRTRFLVWLSACIQYADMLICGTETTKRDYCSLLEELNVDTGKMEVRLAPLGCDLKTETGKAVSETVVHAAAAGPYLLMVCTIEPRKNHTVLLNAFDDTLAARGLNLVIVGINGWKADAQVKRIHGHPLYGKRLFHLSDLSDSDIVYLYKNAFMFVFPTLAEGFGIPAVEALGAGTPALLSDIPVMREIAGDYAVYFDEHDPKDLSTKVELFLDDSAAYQAQREKVRAFQVPSWDMCAECVEEALKKLAGISGEIKQKVGPEESE